MRASGKRCSTESEVQKQKYINQSTEVKKKLTDSQLCLVAKG